ncbi:MAG TPA: hypothetical protein VJW51_04285 [Candidatus Acidoferrales bacterium]|nr:hypothetical protein [Candidatus Acidoferrales bacterium]
MAKASRFAAIAAALVALCGTAWLGYRAWKPAPEGWIQFSAPDGTFTILLPGEPKLEEQEATSESGKPATTIHFVTAKGLTSHFFCHYWSLSYTPSSETGAQIAMAGSRDGLIHGLDGNLLSSQASMSDGHYMQTFKATLPDDGILEGRFFFIGERLYMLSVARPAEQSDEETQKFFGSFKLSSSNP